MPKKSKFETINDGIKGSATVIRKGSKYDKEFQAEKKDYKKSNERVESDQYKFDPTTHKAYMKNYTSSEKAQRSERFSRGLAADSVVKHIMPYTNAKRGSK